MEQCLILFCTLFQVICLGAADDKLIYDQDGGISSVLLKKILILEERDREFDRKIEEIGLLKERLDEAQRRLANMQELEFRLQKAEEQIRMLEHRMNDNNVDCNVKKSRTMKASEVNVTQDNIDIGSSGSVWMRSAVSNIELRQAEMRDKIADLVSFKNRVKTEQRMVAIKGIKKAVTGKVAFTAMFYSSPVTISTGRSLLFDKVDYNEGHAYDPTTGIFTCPISGTYFFFTNIISMLRGGTVQTEIVVEGVGKGRANAFDQVDVAQGSTAAALHCFAGQRVWVLCAKGSQTWGQMFSSFTGVLLWPDAVATNSN